MKGRLMMIAVALVLLTSLAVLPAWSQDQTTPTTTAPAAATQEKAAQSALQIQDAVVCQDVVDRQPVGSGDVFAKESSKVFCFSRVVGATSDTQITHNWYYKGNLKASIQLPVRSSDWRTWSSKTMDPTWTGEWMVEILSEQGTPLESIIFFIQ
jgi:hypothetical protein